MVNGGYTINNSSGRKSLANKILHVENIGKCFHLYDRPYKRLLSLLFSGAFSPSKEFWALKNISFSLGAGETLGIVGRNGAGKSTLLQIICGTLFPTEGCVKVSGRTAALLELGAGFNSDFTGRENIYLNAALYGLTRSEVDVRLDEIINFADIGEFIDRPVKVYSSGMFVRLAFAIVAHVDADLLIIDEALAVGDALFSQKCMRFLEEFKKRGSIVFVSHDSGAVSQLCDKAIWLHEGRFMKEGGAKEITESYLEFLYGEIQGDACQNDEKDLLEPPPYDANLEEWYDCRQAVLETSNIRNDLEVFKFDPGAEKFGTGKVSVDDVYFRDESDRKIIFLVGGRAVNLEVILSVKDDLENFIVGFLVKNRLGQVLFGENSLLFSDSGYSVKKGRRYVAKMKILMPYLAQGEYVLSLGIASGTQKDHVQHCWVHDALIFVCQSTHVVHGLFGVPAKEFSLVENVQYSG